MRAQTSVDSIPLRGGFVLASDAIMTCTTSITALAIRNKAMQGSDGTTALFGTDNV